ncbi:MAG TPA: Gfo/Idh/MocA family oxidoreductase [Sphingobium sp.]|uniref:Gfo/Idh/MocA family protein n=1 Tax=Sphingobium sp. TaxID=1912891 RepID=UPI002ED2D1CA
MATDTGPRVLIVGAGHGCRVHLPALRSAGFEVVGLVGSDLGRTLSAAAAHEIPGAFTDLDAAIAETAADAVAIASPPLTHSSLVLTALARGCHILCEKPFAKDAAEAELLALAAERAGVVHIMGNQMRTLPERILVRQAIAHGLIGDPRLVSIVQYVGLVADPKATRPVWWFDESAGGGWLGASGSHMIDMIRSWLGDFTSVSAALPMVSDRRNVAEDSFSIRFHMANGAEGIVQQTGGAWGAPVAMIRVAGTHGTLWLEGGRAWLADREGTRALPIPEELALIPMEPSSDPKKPYLHVELPPSLRLMENWRAAIEGRPVTAPLATFIDGLAVMQVIDAVRASAAAEGTVTPVAN